MMLIGFLFSPSLCQMCSPKLFQVSYDWVNEFYDVERKSEEITITKLRVCVREREREMNVCVQIFLTQAACHLLNSFHEREKDKHKNKIVRFVSR